MGIFKTKAKEKVESSFTGVNHSYHSPFAQLNQYTPLGSGEEHLYDVLKEAVPIIGAAISKIIRLMGQFEITCHDENKQEELNHFFKNIKVGLSGRGIGQFISIFTEDLLTYGNAAAEIVLTPDGDQIYALYNVPLNKLMVKKQPNSLEIDFYSQGKDGGYKKLKYPHLLLFSALNPKSGEIKGASILKGLPFVSGILLKIYSAIGNNFERVGNLRYAVSYKPNEQTDGVSAKERAESIAKEWANTMNAGKNGEVRDFVSVGDIEIKVIGADNQFIDTNIPVRQMLEQIISKLCIPPFLLGVQWSTTETMSKQQTEILTSELEYFRSLITPVILHICKIYCALQGESCDCEVKWNIIKLQDEIALMQAEGNSGISEVRE